MTKKTGFYLRAAIILAAFVTAGLTGGQGTLAMIAAALNLLALGTLPVVARSDNDGIKMLLMLVSFVVAAVYAFNFMALPWNMVYVFAAFIWSVISIAINNGNTSRV